MPLNILFVTYTSNPGRSNYGDYSFNYGSYNFLPYSSNYGILNPLLKYLYVFLLCF